MIIANGGSTTLESQSFYLVEGSDLSTIKIINVRKQSRNV